MAGSGEMCFQPTWADPSGGWDGKMQEDEERIHSFHAAPTPRFAEEGRKPCRVRCLRIQLRQAEIVKLYSFSRC
jgi:hypothetical protein